MVSPWEKAPHQETTSNRIPTGMGINAKKNVWSFDIFNSKLEVLKDWKIKGKAAQKLESA